MEVLPDKRKMFMYLTPFILGIQSTKLVIIKIVFAMLNKSLSSELSILSLTVTNSNQIFNIKGKNHAASGCKIIYHA